MFWKRKKESEVEQYDLVFEINSLKKRLFFLEKSKPKIGSYINFQTRDYDLRRGKVLHVEYKENWIKKIVYPRWQIIVKCNGVTFVIDNYDIVK